MSADTITEVTSQSWFSRLGGAIKGVLFGIILFIVAFPLLFWNEGRAVARYKTLKEGGGTVISVNADAVEPANMGKLIHVTGQATTVETLTDPVFGIAANALQLERNVEMYQWQESSSRSTKKKLGGGTETVTTYSYSKEWSDELIDSGDFKESSGHENPSDMPYTSQTLVANHVTLGAFTVPSALVERINAFEEAPMAADTTVPAALEGKALVQPNGFYIGTNAAAPQVGDMRVTFRVVKPLEVSIIAAQAGSSFAPYRAKTGGTIELLQIGAVSAEQMIQQAQASNRMFTWILRLVGFLIMLIGLNMVVKPLSVLADVIPILGTIVGAGTGLITLLIAAILSLVTIAVAWIVYRPLLGIVLIIAAVGLVIAIKSKLKKAPRAAAPSGNAPCCS
jgi:hypothetical protein